MLDMIKFEIIQQEIELIEYSDNTSLTELVAELEAFRQENGLKTVNCYGCGECCTDNIPVLGLDLFRLSQGLHKELDCVISTNIIMPEKPGLEARQKSINELVRSNGLSKLGATLIYEYNNSEPLILAKKNSGECCFLESKLCSKYEIRPYSCGLYLCNMGERLSYIEEMIIRLGIWHAYYLLGWVPENEIAHNPFLKAGSYGELKLRDFEFDLKDTLDKLFFYF
jgi:Fe-S-cluster containining protein